MYFKKNIPANAIRFTVKSEFHSTLVQLYLTNLEDNSFLFLGLEFVPLFLAGNACRMRYAATGATTAAMGATKWRACAMTRSSGARRQGTASRPSIGATGNRTAGIPATRSAVTDANAKPHRMAGRCWPARTPPCAISRNG